jgi:hypothetical protein
LGGAIGGGSVGGVTGFGGTTGCRGTVNWLAAGTGGDCCAITLLCCLGFGESLGAVCFTGSGGALACGGSGDVRVTLNDWLLASIGDCCFGKRVNKYSASKCTNTDTILAISVLRLMRIWIKAPFERLFKKLGILSGSIDSKRICYWWHAIIVILLHRLPKYINLFRHKM